jgi:hypothetical protein
MVSVDPMGLGVGVYTGAVTVLSNGASNSPQKIQVVLTVSEALAGEFVDDFERMAGEVLGNGWIEKSEGAFGLGEGVVVKRGVGSGYRDNIVYRPASEDLLDVEASVEFRLLSMPPGYPQVFVRVQSETVGVGNELDGYILYVADDASLAVVGRQVGSDFVATLGVVAISPGLNTVDTFRLRLRAEGVAPVEIGAYVERLIGGSWETIGQAVVLDEGPGRIDRAGSVGFGGYVEPNYVYDNFIRSDLSGAP